MSIRDRYRRRQPRPPEAPLQGEVVGAREAGRHGAGYDGGRHGEGRLGLQSENQDAGIRARPSHGDLHGHADRGTGSASPTRRSRSSCLRRTAPSSPTAKRSGRSSTTIQPKQASIDAGVHSGLGLQDPVQRCRRGARAWARSMYECTRRRCEARFNLPLLAGRGLIRRPCSAGSSPCRSGCAASLSEPSHAPIRVRTEGGSRRAGSPGGHSECPARRCGWFTRARPRGGLFGPPLVVRGSRVSGQSASESCTSVVSCAFSCRARSLVAGMMMTRLAARVGTSSPSSFRRQALRGSRDGADARVRVLSSGNRTSVPGAVGDARVGDEHAVRRGRPSHRSGARPA